MPRIGVSEKPNQIPTKILAYQLMGIEENGNTCPFLDTESGEKSTHGGYPCKIYKSKPLACSAYPLIESNPITLDESELNKLLILSLLNILVNISPKSKYGGKSVLFFIW